MDLKNKTVLITGASSGIGKAAALQFARAGADLAICARREDRLHTLAREIEGIGREVLAVRTDVADREQVNAFVDQTLEKFGKVDILVINAGVYSRSPTLDLDLEILQHSMAVNFYGGVYSIFRTLPSMIDRKQGSIIIVSSMDAKKGVPPDMPYVAAKAAIAGFADVLRQEVRPHGIFVTTLFPGRVDTEMIDHLEFSVVSAKIDAEDVAGSILKAVKNHPAEVILPIQLHLFNLANFISPNLSDWIVKTFKLEGWS